MKYLQLGDRNVSQLVLGTMVFHMGDLAGAYSVFDRFSEAGGNAFDTAYTYSGGDSERVLGQWMKHRKNRSQTFVIAKGGHPNSSVPRPRISPEEVRAELEVSLIRAQTDYFDLYLLHRNSSM